MRVEDREDSLEEARAGRALLSDLTDIAREAASRIIMPRFGCLSATDIRTKSSPSDLVTIADVLAERYITERLALLLPGVLVIGEERCSTEPHLPGLAAQAPCAVTIDPIDGTANFAAGLPLFGVMIAVLSHGKPVASVILDPVAGTAALAARGEGAWMEDATGGIHALRVAAPVDRLDAAAGKISWRSLPWCDQAQANRTMRSMTGLCDLRCAAHEYRLMAGGHAHVLAYGRTCLWDHCPGWLLIREAGGFGARLNGVPFHPGLPGTGLLYASDERAWQRFHKALSLPD
ncbi:inositol monophosphatase family protein [Swaminathania salitolerans]|uniref:Inositol monophosphatase n=1 Tax=Swaminathania salitolerans TaxID=182838 RepID=A0A511BQE5_9PROT|nr:inositol monophosphatase [Swaminathania salitolerans]GBQ11596.1 inositol monophosphatase [Swaminathania salitolerans LMG 21291]GEL02550.1 inositol monophosphatase [Swaminathania salitolerans]